MNQSRSNIALVHFQNRRVPHVRDPLNAVFVGHEGRLHLSVAGPTGWLDSDWLVKVGPASDQVPPAFAPGAGVVAFRQVPDQISIVVVGPNDQLHVTWRGRGVDAWNMPVPLIASHRPVAPASTLAVGQLGVDTWFVIYCTRSGAIDSIRVDGGSNWQSAQQLCPVGAAAPGGGLVAFNQIPEVLTVVYVDQQSHLLHVAWRGVGATHWEGPALIHDNQTRTPPGAALASAHFSANVWYTFFVDEAGQLRAARVVAAAPWDRPEDVSPAGFAPAGAGVAALQDADGEISAFLVRNDGAVCAFRRRRQDIGWTGPLQLTPAGSAEPGASIFAIKQTEGITVVAFPGIDGRPHIAWMVVGSAWRGPARISWFRAARPYVRPRVEPIGPAVESAAPLPFVVTAARVPGTIEHVAQLTGPGTRNDLQQWGGKGIDLGATTEHQERLYFFFGDVTLPVFNNDPGHVPPWDADLVAFTDARQLAPDGVPLVATTVAGANTFFPFSADRLGLLGNVETPTGAFSYNGRCYVFVMAFSHQPTSYLTSGDRPDLPQPFALHGEFSRWKFMQIAPWVVNNARHPGLPSRTGDGVVLVGQGDAPEAMYLAWMPLAPDRPLEEHKLLYYAGRTLFAIKWSPREEDAVPIFARPPRGYTSVSLGYLDGPGKWILAYVKGKSPGDPNPYRDASWPMVARLSNDLFRWSGEVALFDPEADAELKPALHWQEGTSWAYGAFLPNRYQLWSPELGRATIAFLMSTGEPYQVHVMRCDIAITSRIETKTVVTSRLEISGATPF